MIGSRFQPLVVLLVLGGVVLLARLYQVQVTDNEVWTLEAARLVHAGREVPYRRGTIYDRNKRTLARDVDGFGLELVYRTFRQEHPLGQVAHALSLIEGRAVSLEEVHLDLERSCEALVRLTPADWEAFSRGERFYFGGRVVSATADPGGELRGRRGRDLSFYLRNLFEFKKSDWKRLFENAAGGRMDVSLLDLVADRKGRTGAEQEEFMFKRLTRSLSQLERLARMLEWPQVTEDPGIPIDPLDRIVFELERARRQVEDATASRLFKEATGFSPGRIDAEVLTYFFDVSWIARRIGWDGRRTEDWAHTARLHWLRSWRDGYALPRLVWSLALDPVRPHGEEALLDLLAVLFGTPQRFVRALDGDVDPWRELDRLTIFEDLDRVLATHMPQESRDIARRVLPIQLSKLRDLPYATKGLIAKTLAGPDARVLAPQVASTLEANLTPQRLHIRHVNALFEVARTVVDDWEEGFQAGLVASLNAALAVASPGKLSDSGELLFAPENIRRALDGADFFLKDFGMRPRCLVPSDPIYDVVYLLTHYEEEFPGFRVREECRRIHVDFEGDDRRPADRILGGVSSISLQAFLRQRDEAQELRALKRRPGRTAEQAGELWRLIGEVYLHDEIEGVSGIEAFFNRELAGRNGYVESRGLETVFGKGRDRVSVREAEDGRDVVLTLDVDLQQAAQRTLRNPAPVQADPKYDWEWHSEPVGAITFVSVEGEILAAASEPDEGSLLGENSSGQRLQTTDRTFRKPTFQPPGSVFKPFVAAYALERGLDPTKTVNCAPLEDGRAGYVDLHCWNEQGHGEVDLHTALVRSCNSYFAWLGETFSDADFHEMGKLFGFGQPTGVGDPLPWDREETRRTRLEDAAGFARDAERFVRLRPALRRMGGNGLGVIEATPMQVTRAILGLACGELPSLRLAREVGGVEVAPGTSQPFAVGEDVLQRIRKALRGVVCEVGGTARSALGPEVLGLDICAKTGSADYTSPKGEGGLRVVRKHTWVAGWVPAENPVAVFCLFEHDTRATSSHGVVYLAQQFLRQPEVLNWLAGRGVDVSRVEAR